MLQIPKKPNYQLHCNSFKNLKKFKTKTKLINSK